MHSPCSYCLRLAVGCINKINIARYPRIVRRGVPALYRVLYNRHMLEAIVMSFTKELPLSSHLSVRWVSVISLAFLVLVAVPLLETIGRTSLFSSCHLYIHILLSALHALAAQLASSLVFRWAVYVGRSFLASLFHTTMHW
jgi:hypothetical protein